MLKNIEDKIIACAIATTIVLCISCFFLSGKIDFRKTVKLEKEWRNYVNTMNTICYSDEQIGRMAEVQRNIQTQIIGFEFDGLKPIRAYLINGEVKDINWVN